MTELSDRISEVENQRQSNELDDNGVPYNNMKMQLRSALIELESLRKENSELNRKLSALEESRANGALTPRRIRLPSSRSRLLRQSVGLPRHAGVVTSGSETPRLAELCTDNAPLRSSETANSMSQRSVVDTSHPGVSQGPPPGRESSVLGVELHRRRRRKPLCQGEALPARSLRTAGAKPKDNCARLFVTRLDAGRSARDIFEYLRDELSILPRRVEKLRKKGESAPDSRFSAHPHAQRFSSFCVTVEREDFVKINLSSAWEKGASFRAFGGRPLSECVIDCVHHGGSPPGQPDGALPHPLKA